MRQASDLGAASGLTRRDVNKKEKAFYANKHQIPVVSMKWLQTCLQAKKKVALDEFRIELPDIELNQLTGESPAGSPAPSDMLRMKVEETSRP